MRVRRVTRYCRGIEGVNQDSNGTSIVSYSGVVGVYLVNKVEFVGFEATASQFSKLFSLTFMIF